MTFIYTFVAVYHSFSQGWNVQQCQCTFQDQVCRWNVNGNEDRKPKRLMY